MDSPALLRDTSPIKKAALWLKRHLFFSIILPLIMLLGVLIIVLGNGWWPWTPLTVFLHVTLSLFIGCIYLFFQLRHYMVCVKLKNHGLRTSSTVTGKTKNFDWHAELWPAYNHFITYTFLPGTSELIATTQEVSESLWEKLKAGDTIETVFDSASPIRNIPTEEVRHIFWLVPVIIWNTLFIGVAALILSFILEN
ncbi:MAG: hypothetical protein V1894_00205 [Chloroflexota bacterium]